MFIEKYSFTGHSNIATHNNNTALLCIAMGHNNIAGTTILQVQGMLTVLSSKACRQCCKPDNVLQCPLSPLATLLAHTTTLLHNNAIYKPNNIAWRKLAIFVQLFHIQCTLNVQLGFLLQNTSVFHRLLFGNIIIIIQ